MRVKRLLTALTSCFLLLFTVTETAAFAETALPDGAVKGLPERLAALDDEGNVVDSETGEYFFHVEDMQYGETYTKNIQLVNLREDAAYHIYFYTEPLYKAGEIDLEKGCTCRFYLDDVEIYSGDVNGRGNLDLTEKHYDCGYYAPGDSHTLRCEIIWNDLDVVEHVDNGHRLVDQDGTHVLVGSDDSGYVEGEIEFKWIFYAQIDEDTLHSTETSTTENDNSETDVTQESGNGQELDFFPPYTGFLLKSGTFWLVSMGIIAALIVCLLVLIARQRKKEQEKDR